MLSGLVVVAVAAGRSLATSGAASLASLLASLMWVDFSLGKLAGVDALVGLTVLAETVVLWEGLVGMQQGEMG
jgi:hypothetical protein